jgi:transcriptional regulator with XRE-family HTH domain
MLPAEIKALRQRCGDTLEEFARRVGVGTRTYWNWENGKVTPRRLGMDRLQQIARSVDRGRVGVGV